ncbi:MAG TPA: LEA type 2 family protein [Longimicrobiales bacterium]
MTRRIVDVVATVMLVCWAAGCVPRVESPEVRVVGVRLGGLGLQGGLVYVQLSVVNPNEFGLEADRLTYDLDLRAAGGDDEWVNLTEGAFSEEVRVGARDSAVVEIPVEFSYAGVGAAVRSILARGTFDYRVSGRISVTEPISTEVPYRERGTVALVDGG